MALIAGNTVEIGDDVFIGPYCTLATGIHSLIPEERRITVDEDGTPHDFEYGKPIKIGNDVWIGQNVTILPGVHIGDGAIIGLNSVVGSDVAPYTIVAGNPAKVIRKRFDNELIKLLLKLKWWDKSIKEINIIFDFFTTY